MWHAFELLYLVPPVYAANMAAPFVRLLPGTPRPIHERWLGAHKTWQGCLPGSQWASSTGKVASFSTR